MTSPNLTLMIDAAMVAMKDIVPPLRRSDCQRLIVAALEAQAQAQQAPTREDWLNLYKHGDIVAKKLAKEEQNAP